MFNRVLRNCVVAAGLLSMLGAGSAYAIAGVAGAPVLTSTPTASVLPAAGSGYLPTIPGLPMSGSGSDALPVAPVAGTAGLPTAGAFGTTGPTGVAGTGMNVPGGDLPSGYSLGQMLSGVRLPAAPAGTAGTEQSADQSNGQAHQAGGGANQGGVLGASGLSNVTVPTVTTLPDLGLRLPSVIPNR
ncbi:MAG TPA: hypothetical protein VIS06_03820 [Mycobacteriales bacterium]